MAGVLELLPSDQVAFQQILDVIRSGFESYGFLPIATPTMELASVLLQKAGGETERQIYLAQSSGAAGQGDEAELALRFDLTVPLARYVAEHQNQLTFPFRRYQIQPVFRGERPQQGRFREFYQCDIDVIGKESLSLRFDAEIPAVINTVFSGMEIGEFVIGISNRRLLVGLMNQLGIGASQEAMRELDKLARRGPEAVVASLQQLGAPADGAARMVDIAKKGAVHGMEGLAMLNGLESDEPDLRRGVEELIEVLELLPSLGVPAHRYGIDLSIARGLDYYTGTVYETTLVANPGIGSICSGGRYDDLAAQYSSTRMPGVGISIGLSRLFWQLWTARLLPKAENIVVVLVALLDDAGLPEALRLAAELRKQGINTESAFEPRRLGQHLKYADRSGIDFVVVAGPEERERGEALVRDLRHQAQESVPASDVVQAVLRMRTR